MEGEGFSNDVYTDTKGYLTIGYGHKLLEEEEDDLTYVTDEEAE